MAFGLFVNALMNQWAFDFSKTGPKWIAADLALAIGFIFLARILTIAWYYISTSKEEREIMEQVMREKGLW